jgi:G:T/U-mismatch repair DNA glycosylase
MLSEIWAPDLIVVFVGTAVAEVSNTLGFHHLHPRDRFWQLLDIGGITPKQMITSEERKALTDGHTHGTLSDPIRVMFTEKKTSQLLQLGIGITVVNRRVVAGSEKDKAARPSEDDVQQFIVRAEKLNARILAFDMGADLFVDLFKSRYSMVTATLGVQSFRIGNSEVWLLGSTSVAVRGEALAKQEDAFFTLGERISSFKTESANG